MTTAVKKPVSNRLRFGPEISDPSAATTRTNTTPLITANFNVGGREGAERRAVPLAVSRSCGWSTMTTNNMIGGRAWVTARRLIGPMVVDWSR